MSSGGFMRWHYAGYVSIPRATPEGMKETRIPFQFHTRRVIQLSAEEARARAAQVAQQFLQLIQDTAPGRRDDYGQPRQPTFTFVGMLPGTDGPEPGATSDIPDALRTTPETEE